ncbi:hypothetical protein [Aromatoleum diolicum]|uniref:Lipoprotein n=1 Tax=Aromatoleum diolicum TaxID=75796 RepID=A0ABX1QG51_9RHOO|nr:hypothetical protein [Aromatoleum diolicum]NMG76965.1 hypothetical protein [Aromatoleum diolicum]
MRKVRPGLVSALAVFGWMLAGCFSSGNLPRGYPAAPVGEAGLVFGSIGVAGEESTIGLSSLEYRPAAKLGPTAQGEFLFHSVVGIPGALLSPMFHTPVEFHDGAAKGTVFALRLRAGDYEVVSAIVENAPIGGWASHVFMSDAGNVPFRVEAGRATYIGRFLSRLRIGRDAHRIPEVQGAYFVVSDRLVSDLEIVNAKGFQVDAARVINLAPRFMSINNAALRSSPE